MAVKGIDDDTVNAIDAVDEILARCDAPDKRNAFTGDDGCGAHVKREDGGLGSKLGGPALCGFYEFRMASVYAVKKTERNDAFFPCLC